MKIGIAVVVALGVAALFFIFANPSLTSGTMTDTSSNSLTPQDSGSQSGLVVQDETAGAGEAAQPGDTVTVNYTGKLQDGTVFDTSIGKQPFSFVLGAGQVIPGWDEGLVGMKVGGTRTLIIPPSLGYGDQTVGPIPANSTLVFEVNLLSVSSTTPAATQ